MENTVIIRPYQQARYTDIENLQAYADAAHAHLVSDAITPESQFTGLVVTASSSTEISVAPGRLYVGSTGQVYALTAQLTQSVFSLLPVSDEKWLAVSALGQQEEGNIEPRDFLVDIATRQVEPTEVAMLLSDVVVVHVASGLESPTPERPEPPTGYTLLAHVRLSPAGIQEVELATSRALPNLHAVNQRLVTVEGWITSTEPRLGTLSTDLYGLGNKLAERATIAQMMEVAQGVAGLKEALGLPDDYVAYGADHFLTADESDLAATGYSARIEEGIRPAAVASATTALALFNPLDPAVTVTNNFVLPAYSETKRLGIETRAGELTINQYQYQTLDYTQHEMSRTRIRYGESRWVATCSFWWLSGEYDSFTGIFKRDGETWQAVEWKDSMYGGYIRFTQFWVDTDSNAYWSWVATDHQVSGSLLAQTWLSAQTGWLTSIEIYLTSVATDGAITALLCEVKSGTPDLAVVISQVTVQQTALQGGWNKLTWSRPAYVGNGVRYGIALVSGGAHKVGYANGTDYTQGLLFYSQDGVYVQLAANRDLMLRLNYARFDSPRAVVQMDPLELAGGIEDIDLRFEGYIPPGCELNWEYQVAGLWVPVDAQTPPQLGGSLLPLRAVLVGTLDLAPGILLTDSEATVARFDTAFEHWSTERTLAAASSDVRVRVLVDGYNATYHTVTISLDASGTPVAAASTSVRQVAPGRAEIEARFTPAAISAYQIKIVGSTSDAAYPLVVSDRFDVAL